MSELWSITIPGYTTGVATVALVAVAAVGVARDRRRNRQSALRDARKVFGTTSEDRPPGAAAEPGEQFDHVLTVINVSPDPIFEVAAFSGIVQSDPKLHWSPALHQYVIPYVLPGQSGTMIGHWRKGDHPLGSTADPVAQIPYWAWRQLPVVVWWTDGRGLEWARESSNEPKVRKRTKPQK